MHHSLLLPILIPALTGVLLVFLARFSLSVTRSLSFLSAIVQLAIALYLVVQSFSGMVNVYALSNWMPPFGIVLVGDKLSQSLVLVHAVLLVTSILYLFKSEGEKSDNLQPLLHFLTMGVQGAFLTGDLFNLFVFFEIMLIASYALTIFGGGKERTKAGLHYVVLNLVGSSIFILGLGVVYGVLGTMNMADLAQKVPLVAIEDTPLLAVAALLLLLVFGLKAAILPLYFWLPRAYSSVITPVAAIFAIMTKVGLYSMVRVHGMIFNQAPLQEMLAPWLWTLAIVTILAGTLGVLGAKKVRMQLAYTIVISVGTMLAALAMHTTEAMQALMYYLIHSTWITAAFFFLIDSIAMQRGSMGDSIVRGPRIRQHNRLAITFFLMSVSLVGMPPFSGFFGKLFILQATPTGWPQVILWSTILLSGLATIIAFGRTGSTLFWRVTDQKDSKPKILGTRWISMYSLFGLTLLMVVFAEPILNYLAALGGELTNPADYFEAVLNFQGIK